MSVHQVGNGNWREIQAKGTRRDHVRPLKLSTKCVQKLLWLFYQHVCEHKTTVKKHFVRNNAESVGNCVFTCITTKPCLKWEINANLTRQKFYMQCTYIQKYIRCACISYMCILSCTWVGGIEGIKYWLVTKIAASRNLGFQIPTRPAYEGYFGKVTFSLH